MFTLTFSLVSDKPNVTLGSTTSTSISLSWSVSSDSVVDSFEVMWERNNQRKRANGDQQIFVTRDSKTTNYTIEKLKSGVRYDITVTAVNGAGRSSTKVNITTMKLGDIMCIYLTVLVCLLVSGNRLMYNNLLVVVLYTLALMRTPYIFCTITVHISIT